jgi:pheromone a factor receptor
MVVSISIPFFPIVLTLTILNILDLKELKPYSYDAIHHHTEPYPWNTIVYLRAADLGFAYLNVSWIPILSAIPIFGFFGTTKDAMNDYRRLLLFFGLGKIFPPLYQEYDPDHRVGGSSNGSSNFTSTVSRAG